MIDEPTLSDIKVDLDATMRGLLGAFKISEISADKDTIVYKVRVK